MLAAECGERSLLHAAGDFLERNGPADGGEIFIEKLVRSRQRGFCLVGFFPFAACRPGFFVCDDGCGHRIRRTAVARVAGYLAATLAGDVTKVRVARLQKLLSPPELRARSGADFAALGKRSNTVSGAEGERFDGHGGLAAAGSHQAAAVAKKEVLDVMGAVIRIDHRRLRIVSHTAAAEKMHGELLLPRRETPLFVRTGGVKKFVSACEHPIPELQIIRMIFVGQAERRQTPGIFQIRIERKTVVLDREGCTMAEDFHGAVEIVREGGLEVLAPAWHPGGQTSESKTDGREIEASIKPAPSIEADFLWIELIEIVQDAADGEALVIVERILELTGDHATTVEHQVFSDDAAGVRETVGKLFVGREQ